MARLASFFDYLPPQTRVVVEDPPALLEEARRSFSRVRESALHRRAEHRLALDAEEFLLDEEQARLALRAWPRVGIARSGDGVVQRRRRAAGAAHPGDGGAQHQPARRVAPRTG